MFDNQVQVEAPVRLIVVGEGGLVETEIASKLIEQIVESPIAAQYDDEELGFRIGRSFDVGFEKYGDDKLQKGILPMVACYLGRNPAYHEHRAQCNTFVVCAWRSERGYTVVVMPYKSSPDEEKPPVEIMMGGLSAHLDAFEAIGFAEDSHYHEYAASLRQLAPRTIQ